MTVSTTISTSGPFVGNGAATTFDFDFHTNATSEVSVVKITSAGSEVDLVQGTDFTATLNGNQDSNPGGTITYPVSGDPLASTEELLIKRVVTLDQPVDLQNQGAYYPEVVETEFDHLTMITQQLLEIANRSLKVGSGVGADGSFEILTDADGRASMVLAFDVNGNLTLVSGNTVDIDDVRAVYAYQTVADMKSASIDTGRIAITKGYYSVGDGGGATYLIETASSPDGYGDHLIANGNQATLQGIDRNVRSYGAKGDGSSDDSPSIQALLSKLVTLGKGSMYGPSGNYILGSKVSITTSGFALQIHGDGVGVTTFTVPDTNTDGAFDITFTDHASQASVRDMSIIADGESLGTGLAITQPDGGNQHQRSVYITRVEIKGNTPATDYFDTFLNLTGSWRPMLNSVITGGPFGPGVSTDFTDSSYLYKSSVGMDLDDCYGIEIINSYIWSSNIGVSSVTSGTSEEEGIRISNTNIVGVKKAIVFTRSGQEPSLWIHNCHINSRDVGLAIDGCKLFTINGCLMYNEDSGNNYSGTPSDISLDNTTNSIIGGNIFHFAGATDRININLVASTQMDGCIIQGNIFNSTADKGVNIGTSALNVAILHNEWPGTYTTNIEDVSGKATIVERRGNYLMEMESQADTSASGPSRSLYRNSASPADNDAAGEDKIYANNSAGSKELFALWKWVLSSVTDGSEGAKLQLFQMINGTLTRSVEFSDTMSSAQTGMFLLRNNGTDTLIKRVTMGAADSGGTGYRMLRIDN